MNAEHRQNHLSHIGELEFRAKALESLLQETGHVSSSVTDAIVAHVQANESESTKGAQVVARSWVDVEYRERLFADGKAAVAELGFSIEQGSDFVALENTDRVHNVIVCTLCSCYPSGLLGLPPNWYKDLAYRSRVVAEPRAVLREFGLEIDDEVAVRVWDSTAELRYMVVPARPAGTEGMPEQKLAELVTRDSMVGVSRALSPGADPAHNNSEFRRKQ